MLLVIFTASPEIITGQVIGIRDNTPERRPALLPEGKAELVRHAEWPPTYVIYPADDVKQDLSEVLTELLERSVPPDLPRWRIDAGEARKIAGLSIDRGRDA